MARSTLNDLKAQQANAEMSRKLVAIQGSVAAIKGQMRLFESTSRDNPSGHLAILQEMAYQVDQIAAEAKIAKGLMPANAPDNLKANIGGTFRRIGKELQQVYRTLHKAFSSVEESFKDPSRAQSPFDADPISMAMQCIELLGNLIRWKLQKSRTAKKS